MISRAFGPLTGISIHALREEGDRRNHRPHRRPRISIHALREEGDKTTGSKKDILENISIHALREEGDAVLTLLGGGNLYFYPRPPRGGRLCRA